MKKIILLGSMFSIILALTNCTIDEPIELTISEGTYTAEVDGNISIVCTFDASSNSWCLYKSRTYENVMDMALTQGKFIFSNDDNTQFGLDLVFKLIDSNNPSQISGYFNYGNQNSFVILKNTLSGYYDYALKQLVLGSYSDNFTISINESDDSVLTIEAIDWKGCGNLNGSLINSHLNTYEIEFTCDNNLTYYGKASVISTNSNSTAISFYGLSPDNAYFAEVIYRQN